MTVPPRTVASRRSFLRGAAITGSAVVAAPATLALAEAAVAAPVAPALPAGPRARRVAVRGKKAKKCKRSKVRVRGRCVPRAEAKAKAAAKATGGGTGGTGGTGTAGKGASDVPVATQPLPPFAMLSPAERHLVTRFSYGVDPALAVAVAAAGGGAAWFEQQLTAPGTSDPATDQVASWFPSLARTAPELWKRQLDEIEGGWEVMADYQRSLLIRRIRSTRPVLDVMAEFWENHFNIPVNGDAQYLFRVSFGTAMRAGALGRFDQLLTTAVTHPAMGIFLSNAVSTAAHPNENLGRELLELHTVGRGAYTEDDVKSSARILTGWRVDMWRTWAATYKPADHWVGPVKVMGFSDANASSDGRATTAAYLGYLARHPATATRIARKLAVKFVSDTPSAALVDTLARTYLAHDTAIVPVLRALVASAEFQAAAGAKVRDPGEDVVATYRALGVSPAPPTGERVGASAEQSVLWQAAGLGATPHGWPRPDGAPADNASWSSPARLVASLDLHYTMSGGWWPTQGISYRQPVDWLPVASLTFAALVEHLSQRLLHLATPPGLLEACCQATALTPSTVITAAHPLVRWKFPRLLTTVLDSPHHMKR